MPFTSDELRSRWSDVWLAGAARGISYCGDYLAATTLALTLQAGGDHGLGVAALLIATSLPLAIFGSPGGWLADRVDSRVLVVSAALVQAGVCTILAYVHAPSAMICLVAVLAVGSALTQPAMFALTPEMVTSADLPKAMSIMQTAGTLGMLGGPALGGLLTGALGSRIPLLLDAASFVALAAAGFAIRSRRGGRRAEEQARTAADEARPAWNLRQDRLVRTLLMSIAAVVASVTAVTVAEVFFVRGTLGSSPATYGVISSMWELGILIGVWPFGRLRGGDDRLARGEIIILALLSLLLLGSAVVPAAWWLAPIYLIGGVLNGGLNVIVGIIVARRVPRSVRGRVGGTFAAVAAAANFAGYVAGGVLLPVMTPRSLIALSAAVSLVVALAFLVPSGTTRVPRAVTTQVAAPVD